MKKKYWKKFIKVATLLSYTSLVIRSLYLIIIGQASMWNWLEFATFIMLIFLIPVSIASISKKRKRLTMVKCLIEMYNAANTLLNTRSDNSEDHDRFNKYAKSLNEFIRLFESDNRNHGLTLGQAYNLCEQADAVIVCSHGTYRITLGKEM